VSDWPWDAVRDLRRDQNMARFRAILREVEQEAAADAVAGGDLEAAAHRAYRRHLADAQEAVDSIGAVAHSALRAFVIGAVIGFATVGIAGPLGVVAGAAAGAVPGAVIEVRDVMRQRKTCGWVAVQQRIDGMRLSGCSPTGVDGDQPPPGSSAVRTVITAGARQPMASHRVPGRGRSGARRRRPP
jgi:hypothetical protein